jgi:hypothetical protein
MQVAEQEQYVEFGIEKEQYAIRIQDIHEIIKIQEITQILNVMPHVKGVDGNIFVGIGVTKNGLVGILKLDEVLIHE